MRLDKFLKVSRVIKRRTVANEACDSGRVMINGKVAKASTEVKLGDIVEIKYGEKIIKFEIKNIVATVGKDGASEMIEMISWVALWGEFDVFGNLTKIGIKYKITLIGGYYAKN